MTKPASVSVTITSLSPVRFSNTGAMAATTGANASAFFGTWVKMSFGLSLLFRNQHRLQICERLEGRVGTALPTSLRPSISLSLECSFSWQYVQSSSQLLPSGGLSWWLLFL